MSESRLSGFAENLHQDVLSKAAGDATPPLREEAFTECVLELLDEHNELAGWEVCSYETRSHGPLPAAKINAWALSGDGATLDLFVAKYHGTGEVEEVGKPDVRRHIDLVRGFLRRALGGHHAKLEESSPGFEPASRIHQAQESLTAVRFFFLTDGVVRSLEKIDEEEFPGLEVSHVVWDLDKLSRLRAGQREVIELDFENDHGGAIPCLQEADATGEYRTYLAYIRGPLLAQIYGKYGQRLLERNVRAFLQSRGKVNRGLQKTLKEEPHRFLAYNNGLCCTAAEVGVRAGQDGHAHLLWARDFQIVNGGQTTASIHHALRKEKINIEQAVVQVKLTVLSDAGRVQELVPLISRYANSQNKVNAADFSANGRFHHGLEQLSRTVWTRPASGLERGTHWYYERARGSYADDRARQDTPGKRRAWDTENPREQKFTKTDLAKFEHAWMCLPHLVCLGAEKNFNRLAERMEDDGEPEVNELFFQHIVAKAILFRTAERLFSTLDLTGYRANSVAYAMAWLAARTGWRIDLDRIWATQRASPTICAALKQACTAAHGHITGQQGNPGEASKREECWDSFKAIELPVPDALMAELSTSPFMPRTSEQEMLSPHWENLRQQFIDDHRTMGELEATSGKTWIAKRRGDEVCRYAAMTWEQLRMAKGIGLKKMRALVELLAAVART